MLIDFSSALRISLFDLGSTYVRLVSAVHLDAQVPIVEPEIYIRRFATDWVWVVTLKRYQRTRCNGYRE